MEDTKKIWISTLRKMIQIHGRHQEDIIEDEEKDRMEAPHVALEGHTMHQNAGSIQCRRGER